MTVVRVFCFVYRKTRSNVPVIRYIVQRWCFPRWSSSLQLFGFSAKAIARMAWLCFRSISFVINIVFAVDRSCFVSCVSMPFFLNRETTERVKVSEKGPPYIYLITCRIAGQSIASSYFRKSNIPLHPVFFYQLQFKTRFIQKFISSSHLLDR